MAFGITRSELKKWKEKVSRGEIAFLTHYWLHPQYPSIRTVTKVGCININMLQNWCRQNGLPPKYIHQRDDFPHFDLMGRKQYEILMKEGLYGHIKRFNLKASDLEHFHT